MSGIPTLTNPLPLELAGTHKVRCVTLLASSKKKSRALTKFDPSLSSKLREFGLLTRDPRMPERKKYGQKKARKKLSNF